MADDTAPLPRIDETKRPRSPELPGVGEHQRRLGKRLAVIHAAYLTQLSQVELLLDAIQGGTAAPQALLERLRTLEMAENLRLFGNLCGRECHVLGMHHTIEEQMMFPGLASRTGNALSPVLEQLRAEHRVVHDLLGRLEFAADRLVRSPDEASMARCTREFRALVAAVRSHFAYEETELEGALGLHPQVL